MEQRHRGVGDVVGAQVEGLHHRARDPLEPAVRADHRLGRAARARREDQREARAVVDPRLRGQHGVGERRERGVVRRVVGDEDAPVGRTEVETVEQVEMTALGDHELALGVRDVALELGAPTCRVDADDRRAAHRRGAQPHRVLGHVVEQHADVRLALTGHGREQRRAGGARLHPLDVRPRLVFEAHRDAWVVATRCAHDRRR